MKMYVVYDQNGNILRAGKCADTELEAQAQEGEFVIEGVADDERQIVVDGSIVDKEVPDTTRQHKELEQLMRHARNKALKNTDYTMISDVPSTPAQKREMKTYRQQLRDLTDHPNWPDLQPEDWPTIEA